MESRQTTRRSFAGFHPGLPHRAHHLAELARRSVLRIGGGRPVVSTPSLAWKGGNQRAAACDR